LLVQFWPLSLSLEEREARTGLDCSHVRIIRTVTARVVSVFNEVLIFPNVVVAAKSSQAGTAVYLLLLTNYLVKPSNTELRSNQEGSQL